MDAVTREMWVEGYEHIRHGGNALRHALGVLLLAWRQVVRAAGIAMLVGIALTEVVGAVVTRHFPPYVLTHVVAFAVGIALAYCVGLTVLVDELLKGTLVLVRMALGEVEAGARAAAIIAEREVGDVFGWARRLIIGRDATSAVAARPRLAAPNPAASRATSAAAGALPRPTARALGQFPVPPGGTAGASGAQAPRLPAQPPESGDRARLRVPPRLGAASNAASTPPRDETQEDIVATDAFRKTLPPAPADAQPVRTDRLPRIEWAAEGLAAGAALLQSALAARTRQPQQLLDASDAPPPAEVSLDPMPPLPRRESDAAAAPPSLPAPAPQAVEARATLATVPLAPAPELEATAAPPTIPLELDGSSHPSPIPRSSVRTIPVITDDTNVADYTANMTHVALDAPDIAAAPAAMAAADERGGGSEAHPAPAQLPRAEAEPGSGRSAASAVAPDLDPGSEPEPEPGSDAPWEPPSRTIVLPATEGGSLARHPSADALSVHPSDDEASGTDARGLWSRIGQALTRSTTRPLRERGDEGDVGETGGAADQRGR